MITTDITFVSVVHKRIDALSSRSEGMNTSIHEAIRPALKSGIVTSLNTWRRFAPRMRLHSSSSG